MSVFNELLQLSIEKSEQTNLDTFFGVGWYYGKKYRKCQFSQVHQANPMPS